MFDSKSKPVYRAPLLCTGYIVAFSLLLMAFEYKEVRIHKEEIPQMRKVKAVPEAHPQPVKPDPDKKKVSESKEVDPSLTPEPRKYPKEKLPEPDPKNLEDELGMKGIDDPEDRVEMKVPEYKPQKPVPAHELDRFAILPSCNDREDVEAKEACTTNELKDFFRSKTEYPESLQEQGIEGEATLVFVVDRNGKVGKVRVLQSTHPELKRAIQEAVRELPDFIPARMKGYKVPMRRTIPLRFGLE